MAATFQLRCHHCKQWLGEAPAPMEMVLLCKDPRDCEQAAPPRYTWRCKACGWANVFRVAAGGVTSWREVELKGDPRRQFIPGEGGVPVDVTPMGGAGAQKKAAG